MLVTMVYQHAQADLSMPPAKIFRSTAEALDFLGEFKNPLAK